MNFRINQNTPLAQKHNQKLLEAAKCFNSNNFLDSSKKFEEISQQIRGQVDSFRSTVTKWHARVLYEKGDYLSCLKLLERHSASLLTELGAESLEKLEVPGKNEDLLYGLLESKHWEAKVLKKIKELKKAEDIVDAMWDLLKEKVAQLAVNPSDPEVVVSSWWKFVMKSLYLKADQYCQCKEFKTAKIILEEQAKPILLALLRKENPSVSENELPMNAQTFKQRKIWAKYLRKFGFYEKALTELRTVLKDEMVHYKLEGASEERKDENSSSSPPSMASIPNYLAQEAYILHPKDIPYLKLKDTYVAIGQVLLEKNLNGEAVANFQIAENILSQVFGSKDLIAAGRVQKLQVFCYLKQSAPRARLNKQSLELAKDLINNFMEMVKSRVGEERSVPMAQALNLMGELASVRNEKEEAEKCYHQAQTMIGVIFSENHPMMLRPNQNLVEVYGQQKDEEKKMRIGYICEKNIEIAQKAYGEKSVYCIRFFVAMASSYIATKQIGVANQFLMKVREILLVFHDNNAYGLLNQYYFAVQALLAMTLMGAQSYEMCERLLATVLQQQILYVENDREHPFLEQTLINLGIYYRTMQSLPAAIKMFEQLAKVQENITGDKKEALIYTYKSIGMCYLGQNEPDKAEEFYEKALKIIFQLKEQNLNVSAGIEGESEEEKTEIREDNEQIASIYFNMYLSAATSERKEKAKMYNIKHMEYQELLFGEKSIQVSNCQFIQSQLMLKTGDVKEARRLMQVSIDLLDACDFAEKSKESAILIKIKYLLSKANICYIMSDFQEALASIEAGISMCQDKSFFSYESIADVERLLKELQSMKLKSQANVQKTNVQKLKLSMKKDEEVVEEGTSLPLSTAAVFALTGSTSFFLALLYKKALA